MVRALVTQLLEEVPLGWAAVVFLVQNILVFLAAIALGTMLCRRFAERRVTPAPGPVDARERWLTTSTTILNAAITWLGLVLHRRGLIHLTGRFDAFVLVEVALLVVVMDFAMYGLHRVAHHPWLLERLHGPHHAYPHPRPLTLFVLHPLETLSFGGLWLLVLMVHEVSWLAITVYLTLNLVWGVVGHVGVEPTPALRRRRSLRWLAGSAFHAGHHVTPSGNFGFYTTVWDRLFGTLAADYDLDEGAPEARREA
ncbi:MAG: sterol desaturase family protein [Polyangiaceae bacterium]